MSTGSNGEPMYFASLEVENVKCFLNRQRLDLTDTNGAISPWTLILGDNGVGKTSLLKCLAWMLPVEAPPTTDDGVFIKPVMDDLDDESEFDQLIRVGNDVDCSVRATFSNGTKLGEISLEDALVTTGMEFQKVAGELVTVHAATAVLPVFNRPNLFAYGANRHMGKRNYDQADLKNPVSNLFSDFGDLYDAGQALTSLEYASLKEGGKGKATALFAKVKQILVDLLPDIKEPEGIVIKSQAYINSALAESLVQLQTPYGEVPLQELSLGYKTMLSWVVDLAIRMLWQNPDMERPLEQYSVVIIDEIDLHLHPKWQRNLREYLLKHFPNTQFICTAHSPFMAQSSETENLCVLDREGDEVIIRNNPADVRGWRIGQIATSDLFGLDSERSPDVERSVNLRRALLDKPDPSLADQAELKKLDTNLSRLSVTDREEDQRMLDDIRDAANLLREKGKL
jgi:energy-coupling factor transporter ATP-binding protein EcfA2